MTLQPLLGDDSSWNPVSLQNTVNGTYVGPIPSLLHRTDGQSLLYPGRVHSIAGEPGSGKSWVALVTATQVIEAGGYVIYADFEDTDAAVVHRLLLLGLTPIQIVNQFGYVGPSEPLPQLLPEDLRKWMNVAQLVVLDGVTNAMELHDQDPLSNRDAATFMAKVVQPFSQSEAGAAVLLIDHLPKAKRNQRSPLGAQHKTAAVQVQYTAAMTTPFDQDHDGSIELLLTKDRYGQIQRLTSATGPLARKVANVRFTHDPITSQLNARVEPPVARGSTTPAVYEERVVSTVVNNPGISRTDIKSKTKGKDGELAAALDRLLERGDIMAHPAGRTDMHYVSQTDSTGFTM